MLKKIAVFLIANAVIVACNTEKETNITYRLPNDVSPTHYVIQLKPYINAIPPGKRQFQFEGFVHILFNILRDGIDQIVLHSKRLNITSITFIRDAYEEIEIVNTEFDVVRDFYIIKLKEKLNKKYGYILKLNFEGKMSEYVEGFYRSSYVSDNGTKIWIGATLFQPNYARQAFPCFDEPHLKAEFYLEIEHEKGLKVVSNMNIWKQQQVGDRIITSFMRTPKMPTYSLAFVLSDFTGPLNAKYKMLMRSNEDARGKMNYVFDEVPKILRACNEYFAIDFESLGIGKVHVVAIPGFNGAMENWGLITAAEHKLFYDLNHTTDFEQEIIFETVTHELVHMWFGNFVTMDWWNHLWLNEGFANYFQFIFAEMLNPDWESEKHLVVDLTHTSMLLDSRAKPSPLSRPYDPNEDPNRAFSTSTYDKSASVIRMFSYILGKREFKLAIRNYLHTWERNNAKPEDLFVQFEKQWSHSDVKAFDFFKNWTEQRGYPVVKVKVADSGSKIVLSQERFLLMPDEGGENIQYIIPFTYATQKNPNFSLPERNNIRLLISGEIALPLTEQLNATDYLIANIGHIGFYRVEYEYNMLRNIYSALISKNHGGISEINRAHLIDDLFNFARSGHSNYTVVFQFSKCLFFELNYFPWQTALNHLDFVQQILGQGNVHLKNYLRKVFENVYRNVTFEQPPNEKRLDTYKKTLILKWACMYDYKNCRNRAHSLFSKFKEDPTKSININIRQVVYSSVIAMPSSSSDLEFLFNRYRTSKSRDEKFMIVRSFGYIATEHMHDLYEFILSDDVDLNDKYVAYETATFSPNNAEQLLRLVVQNITRLEKAFQGGEDVAAGQIHLAAQSLVTAKQKLLIKEVIDIKLGLFINFNLKQCNDIFEKNEAWRQRHENDIIAGINNAFAR